MAACAICGAPAASPLRVPAAEQSPDLDGRPGEPARSALQRQVRVCRTCGVAAPDLSCLPETAVATIASDGYRALMHEPAHLRPHLLYAAILEGGGDASGAGEATLRAAWAADDAGAQAATLRVRAAALLGPPADAPEALRLADILRRAGEFAAAEALAASVAADPADDVAARIAGFQLLRIAGRDAGRHLMSSAVRPPSRTPHAAHGKPPPRRGLWAKLRGV